MFYRYRSNGSSSSTFKNLYANKLQVNRLQANDLKVRNLKDKILRSLFYILLTP